MKNSLKTVFSHTPPSSLRETIHFNDNDKYNDFLKKLEILYETGEPQQIDGINKLTANQVISGKEYPLITYDKIADLIIYPEADKEAQISVQTEFGEYIWKFAINKFKKKITSKTTYNRIIEIIIDFYEGNNIGLTIMTKPEEAKGIEELSKAYSATISLLNLLVAVQNEDIDRKVSRLKKVIEFTKRIMELEKLFGITFVPQLMIDNHEDEEIAEELYIAVIRNKFIRKDKYLSSFEFEQNSMDANAVKNVELGKPMSFCYKETLEINLFCNEIQIYTVNVLSNCVIDSFENDEINKKYKAIIKKSDTHPAYISYRAFISKEEQENEMERLISNYNEYVKDYVEAMTLNYL